MGLCLETVPRNQICREKQGELEQLEKYASLKLSEQEQRRNENKKHTDKYIKLE